MKKLLSLILVAIMLVTAMPMAFAEGNTYKVGDIVQFGSYPQSEVKDETLIAELNALAPEWEDWTSYGYYSGTGGVGTMKQGDWMRYTDVTHNGDKYRGVKFTRYRPFYTGSPYANDTYQDDNGYILNTAYWFKFELIDWRVLNPATGLVVCETIIDSQAYSNTVYDKFDTNSQTYDYFNDSTYTNFASDYETSSIRKWLNNNFYTTAFSESEKKEIYSTTLNNDGYCTLLGYTGYEKIDSNLTTDKIFLLSYNEVMNSDFGFASSGDAHDKARQAQGSDYAKCQGLEVSTNSSYYGTSYWLLRSPGDFSFRCCFVYYFGSPSNKIYVYDTDVGIRPALRCNRISGLVLSEHEHSYDTVVTQSTCMAKGYTKYTCECGDTYKENYVDKLNHKDDNGDYKCDYNCGYEFEKPTFGKELNFFEKIIQWFKDLFDKLFGWLK